MQKLSFLFLVMFCFSALTGVAQNKDTLKPKLNHQKTNNAKKNSTVKVKIPNSIVDLFGVQATSFLANANQLELFIIKSIPDSTKKGISKTHILGYEIIEQKDSISNKSLESLKFITLNPSSYYWDGYAKSCVFSPYIAAVYSNSKSKDKFVTLFCFSCDEWKSEFNGKVIKRDLELPKKQLLQIFKNIFKENQTIQTLK